MKQNKKAFVFALFVVFSSLIILIVAAMTLYAKQNKFNAGIGDGEAKLITAYTEVEKTLFYLDQAAKITAYEAFEELLKKKNAVNSAAEYKSIFEQILAEKIRMHNRIPFLKKMELPADYILTLRTRGGRTDIIGTALKSLYYIDDINKIKYRVKPNFKIEANFNLEKVSEAEKKTRDVLDNCAGMRERDFKRCADIMLDESWGIGEACSAEDKPDDSIVPLCHDLEVESPFDPEKRLIIYFTLAIPAKITAGCCSPSSTAAGADCKASNINGWWTTPDKCTRISATQSFADRQEGKICCIS